MVFNSSANPPCFAPRNADEDEDENQIQKGTKVRLKIVGTRVDATEIFAIGEQLPVIFHCVTLSRIGL